VKPSAILPPDFMTRGISARPALASGHTSMELMANALLKLPLRRHRLPSLRQSGDERAKHTRYAPPLSVAPELSIARTIIFSVSSR
jgi:hypothetical protein